MPNCQAETIAVGGSLSRWAEARPCSARATATAMAAARDLSSAALTLNSAPAGGAEPEMGCLSAVRRVKSVIMAHNRRMAPKTMPMPRAVIHKAVEIVFMMRFLRIAYYVILKVLNGYVAVFAREGRGIFIAQGGKGSDDLRAALARLDNVIHVAGGGGVIRVVEFGAIFGGELLSFG